MTQSSPDIIRLFDEWRAESKRHTIAANEDCQAGTEEWMLHAESARIYRKCADQLIASVSRGVLDVAAEAPDPAKYWREMYYDLLKRADAGEFTGAAQPQRISGASNQVEEAACLIWAELCPDMVMGDDDLPHYEAAAKAVLALSSTPRETPVGLDWTISEETKKQIEEIDRNIREAPQNIARTLTSPQRSTTGE